MFGRVKGILAWDGHRPNSKEAKEYGATGCPQHATLEFSRRPGQDHVDLLHDFYSDCKADSPCACGGLLSLNAKKD